MPRKDQEVKTTYAVGRSLRYQGFTPSISEGLSAARSIWGKTVSLIENRERSFTLEDTDPIGEEREYIPEKTLQSTWVGVSAGMVR